MEKNLRICLIIKVSVTNHNRNRKLQQFLQQNADSCKEMHHNRLLADEAPKKIAHTTDLVVPTTENNEMVYTKKIQNYIKLVYEVKRNAMQ